MEDGFLRFEWVPLERALAGAKLLFLNSTTNPTGALLRPEDLARIAWLARKHDLLILSDEVYDQMTYGATAVSPAAFAPARTLVVNSFSKSFGLAASSCSPQKTGSMIVSPGRGQHRRRSPILRPENWHTQIEDLVEQAYRHVAPPRLRESLGTAPAHPRTRSRRTR
jgi:hypothetical protein